MAAGIEDGVHDPGGVVRVARARQAERRDGVVVRPDRSVVVGHRVVARLAGGEGPDAPPGEHRVAHELLGHPPRAGWRHDPRPQAVAGVGGPHPADALRAVERDAVCAQLVDPEGLLELGPQLLRLRGEALGQRIVAERLGQRGRTPLRGEDVALDLAQRDRSFRKRPIGVKD